MNARIKPSISLILLTLICSLANAQDISFSNLNVSNGLSDNFVKSLAVDQNGFLWIGTADGLNRYDGYGTTIYSVREYPDMPTNYVAHLYCDTRNRIWMGTPQGVAYVDEKRNIHRVILNDTVVHYNSSSVFETKDFGVVLFTSLGQFYFDQKSERIGTKKIVVQ